MYPDLPKSSELGTSSAQASLKIRKTVEPSIGVASPAKDSLKSPEESITSDTYEEDSSAAGKSGTDNGSGEDSEARKKYRLQRQKGKSRKTFRFRKGSKKGIRNSEEPNSNKTDPDTVLEEDPNMISTEAKEAQEQEESTASKIVLTTDQTKNESKSEEQTEQKEGQ